MIATVATAQTTNLNAGRSETMKIDSANIPHLMGVLTNLYSDPMSAIIREYLTNAADAHVSAGKADVPIRVSIPSSFSPVFSVRDHGNGLSDDDVFAIFGSYGESTKRSDNTLTGCLGLGCKSGLAYQGQFSLESVHNGTRSVYSVHKDELGFGRITKLYSEESTLQSGITVTIPVTKDIRSFLGRFTRFAKYFPFPLHIINSNEFPMLERDLKVEVLTQINDHIYQAANEDRNLVVMNGVAYPIDISAVRDLLLGICDIVRISGIVINVQPGEIDFTPSREELHYTKKTLNTIKDYLTKAKSTLEVYLEATLNNFPTYGDAHAHFYSTMTHLSEAFKVKPKYHGIPLVWSFDLPPSNVQEFSTSKYASRNKLFLRSLRVSDYHGGHAIVIEQSSEKDWSHSTMRKHIKAVLNELKKTTALVFKGNVGNSLPAEILAHLPKYNLDYILEEGRKIARARQAVKPRSKRSKTAKPTYITLSTYEVKRDISSIENVYNDGQRRIYSNTLALGREAKDMLKALGCDDITIYFPITKHRVPKPHPLETFDNAIEIKAFLLERVNELLLAPTDEFKYACVTVAERYFPDVVFYSRSSVYDLVPDPVLKEALVYLHKLRHSYYMREAYTEGLLSSHTRSLMKDEGVKIYKSWKQDVLQPLMNKYPVIFDTSTSSYIEYIRGIYVSSLDNTKP